MNPRCWLCPAFRCRALQALLSASHESSKRGPFHYPTWWRSRLRLPHSAPNRASGKRPAHRAASSSGKREQNSVSSSCVLSKTPPGARPVTAPVGVDWFVPLLAYLYQFDPQLNHRFFFWSPIHVWRRIRIHTLLMPMAGATIYSLPSISCSRTSFAPGS
jgi:hypothetical protein